MNFDIIIINVILLYLKDKKNTHKYCSTLFNILFDAHR